MERAPGGHRAPITWAGNAISIGFHTAMGFRIVDAPGTRQILGVTAFPDYEYPGEDRVVFARGLESPS